MNFLETILATKREEVARRKQAVLRASLEDMPGYGAERRSFAGALTGKDMAIIAEIKKASPSRNVLRENFDPREIARRYLHGGACALSVLTDEKFFQGRLDFLAMVRYTAPLPILRKDFLIDAYQIHEARAFGADAVLLIAAALDRNCLRDLAEEARLIGLETMVEVHTAEELESLDLPLCDVVGINNRDLMTFDTDILTTIRLRKMLPPETVVVSESGIRTSDDLRLLAEHNVHAVLIGETLMTADDPGAALRNLLAGIGTGST